jgi:hypothetical protein
VSTLPPGYPQPLPYATPVLAGGVYRDIEHLNILGICHYVWGGLVMLFGCLGLFYIVLGIMFINGTMPGPNPVMNGPSPAFNGAPGPPPQFGWIFVIMGAGFILFSWTLGILSLFAGYNLRARRRRTFCMVVAGFNCLSIPLGTVLGVFTFIVLARPTMTGLFASPGNPPG